MSTTASRRTWSIRGCSCGATALTEPTTAIIAFCEPMRKVVAGRPLIGATDLMAAVQEAMPLKPGVTDAETTASEAFALQAGAVQDQVHVFLACCRYLGLPARYVSGYAYTPDRAAVASRAWAEVWISNRWVGFDVGQGSSADGGHIKLAVGPGLPRCLPGARNPPGRRRRGAVHHLAGQEGRGLNGGGRAVSAGGVGGRRGRGLTVAYGIALASAIPLRGSLRMRSVAFGERPGARPCLVQVGLRPRERLRSSRLLRG